jgi:hypothetical protein
LESAVDSAVVGTILFRITLAGRAAGAKLQKYAASDPASSRSSRARRALLTTDSILPRWRTIPASARHRVICRSPNRATLSISKLAKAARKFSRFRRIVSHDRPD